MPLIRFLVFKRTTYYFKLVAVILSLNKIMPTYFCYIEKGLVYIIIMASLGRQPSFYIKCTKLNMRLSCDIRLIFDVKYIFLTRLYVF